MHTYIWIFTSSQLYTRTLTRAHTHSVPSDLGQRSDKSDTCGGKKEVPNKERWINKRRRRRSHTNDTAECNICQASLCPWGREAYGNRIVARMKRLWRRRACVGMGLLYFFLRPATPTLPARSPEHESVGVGRKRDGGGGQREEEDNTACQLLCVCVYTHAHRHIHVYVCEGGRTYELDPPSLPTGGPKQEGG